MSGGLDSSVAAFCLKQKYDQVLGITLRLGSFTDKTVAQAKKIAEKIKIKHQVIDLTAEFREQIIFPFCQDYFQGLTPNPCVWCNQKIKFGILFDEIEKQGIDYLATGHYARLCLRREMLKPKIIYQLLKAKDKTRDQSYFLYRLNQNQLSKIIFPLGKLTKQQVRKIAWKNNLIEKEQKESREICFIPQNNYRHFLKTTGKKITESSHLIKEGLVKNIQGEVLGKHQGLPFYTIGQRKGLIKGQPEPVYVVKINKEENTLMVGLEKDLYQQELIAENINWVYKKPKLPLRVKAKIRYRHSAAKAKITNDQVAPGKIKVEFTKPQRAITPGQSIVFYQKNQVLGGGIIK